MKRAAPGRGRLAKHLDLWDLKTRKEVVLIPDKFIQVFPF
jgi:hypothetical protein